MASKTKRTKATKATRSNSTAEQRQAIALRNKGLSFRAIERKIFGDAAGNGSWAQYNLRRFGAA